MTSTSHQIRIGDSADLSFIPDGSVGLVVTSPPYPMIDMWDESFAARQPRVNALIEEGDGWAAFELMHEELDRVWSETYRVLVDGGIACINIGDATRTVAGRFRLYPNHARILTKCVQMGFDVLPAIIWRKQTNAPNKFMGSGMLPPGAYVTLEHEYILVVRKGAKRGFTTPEQKTNRRRSAYFWEERNTWFSDLWDLKGARQALSSSGTASGGSRSRSGAYPFELAYRLVHMYSCREDTVLDPFVGTGTTTLAAIAGARDSVGVEVDATLLPVIAARIAGCRDEINEYLVGRVADHREFCAQRERDGKGAPAHQNGPHGFPVITGQEEDLVIEAVGKVDAAPVPAPVAAAPAAAEPVTATWTATYAPFDRVDGPGPLFGTGL